MNPLLAILAGSGLLAASGVPGLFFGWRGSGGQPIANALAVAGAAIGLAGTLFTLVTGTGAAIQAAWPLPGAAWAVEVDLLGAFFLVPIFLISGLGSIYGTRYWPQSEHPANGRRLRFFWGTLAASLALVVLARHAVVFLFGWEIMAFSAFFLVGTEDQKPEVRDASWIYLLAAHVATLCLFAMFALLRNVTGSFAMRPIEEGEAGVGTLTVLFLLMVVGFGFKAGLLPFHIWLPSAHANAPSHVSAMLSGVVLKVGIYGFVRFLGYLPGPPPGWGALLLLLGGVSGVLGVAFAIGQHDLKRLLAYHSVENIGIIVMGLGLAMLGRSLGRPEWVLFGMAGCLLHVWNHALFKSLLFFSAGGVVHALRSREIDHMGGLAKSMPRTSALFLIGAVAICGLPPLNGFVSELLIYTGLFGAVLRPGGAWTLAALGVPCLAMIGALALACFVKAYGAVFLGQPRSVEASGAHEAPAAMTGSAVVLAACCAVIGLWPSLFAPLLERTSASWSPGALRAGERISATLPLGWISVLGLSLAGAVALSGAAIVRRLARRPVPSTGTWDCGYARPSARMQYTSSSFAQMLVGLLRAALRPIRHRPSLSGTFPKESRFESRVDDTVLDGLILPFLRRLKRRTDRIRAFQHGRVQEYILYVLVTLLVLLLWTLPLDPMIRGLFTR